jgi:hypothetical protein
MVEPVGQLHRPRVRRHRVAHLALALVSAAPGCTAGGRSAPGVFPRSTHYHGLAVRPGEIAVAAHDAVYTSADGRAWTIVRNPVEHPLAIAFSGGDLVVGGQGLMVRGRPDRWRELLRDVTVQAIDQRGDTVWVLGEGLRSLQQTGPATKPSVIDDGIAALSSGKALYAAGPNFGVIAGRGEQWTDLHAPVPPTAIAVAERRLKDPISLIVMGGVTGLWRWNGAWHRLPLDPAGPVAAIAIDRDITWVLAQGGVLYRSADEGKTWRTVARVSAG